MKSIMSLTELAEFTELIFCLSPASLEFTEIAELKHFWFPAEPEKRLLSFSMDSVCSARDWFFKYFSFPAIAGKNNIVFLCVLCERQTSLCPYRYLAAQSAA
jgi:hypothetical protein